MTDHLFIWPELIRGTLIRRYKRFLADVLLEVGETIVVHCPNSGRMLTCSEPGRQVYRSYSANKTRKLPWTWEMIGMPDSLVVVNTLRTNALVKAAVQKGFIPELSGYTGIKGEVPVGNHSRIDFLLTAEGREPCLMEVKSSTLVETGIARFPDAVTVRGLKHLRELRDAAGRGYRSVMFYLVQRTDARAFEPACAIDPAYGRELKAVHSLGVEIVAYDTLISPSCIDIGRRIPVIL